MKHYFNTLPTTEYPYDIPNSLIKGKAETTDLSIRFKIVEKIMSSPNSYYEYYWKDEDRVDIVADKYYGDPNLAWLVLLSAGTFDVNYDLPMKDNVFEAYLQSKYNVEDINDLRFIVHHYEDISGAIIDFATFNAMNNFSKISITIFDYENTINEKKRHIKLLSKAYVSDVLHEFGVKTQEIKNNRRLFKSE